MIIKTYITIKEFLEIGQTSGELTISTKRFGKLKHRYKSPVSNLKFESGNLSWNSQHGDSDFVCLKPDTIMKDITDDGEEITSIYRIDS